MKYYVLEYQGYDGTDITEFEEKQRAELEAYVIKSEYPMQIILGQELKVKYKTNRATGFKIPGSGRIFF